MIKSALKKILLRLSAPQAERFFDSYEEAALYCSKRTRNSYESTMLSRYRFAKFNNFLAGNGNLLASPSATVLFYVISIYLLNNNRKIPRVIDFGGACGESIVMLASLWGGVCIKQAG